MSVFSLSRGNKQNGRLFCFVIGQGGGGVEGGVFEYGDVRFAVVLFRTGMELKGALYLLFAMTQNIRFAVILFGIGVDSKELRGAVCYQRFSCLSQ